MTLPNKFVWSKVGPQAGLGIVEILRWRDLPRRIGRGRFYWGIGRPLGQEKLRRLSAGNEEPVVLFSKQPSPGKPEDISPDGVVIWTHFLDQRDKEQPLPLWAAVTSKATSPNGKPKTRHYALRCFRTEPLEFQENVPFDIGHYMNLGGNYIDKRQRTAVIERRPRAEQKNIRRYSEGFLARLHDPPIITLTKPKPLTPKQVARRKELMSAGNTTVAEFERFLKQLRRDSV